jgi:hypothetical protein
MDTLSSIFSDSESFLRINEGPDAFSWLIVSLASIAPDSHYFFDKIEAKNQETTHDIVEREASSEVSQTLPARL